MVKNTIIFVSITFVFLVLVSSPIFAGPTSTNYELKNYGIGAGGTDGSDSTNYSLFGFLGEQIEDQGSSGNYKAGPGLVFTMQANLPDTPTFSNPSDTYDRLKFIIDDGGNPSDATFAIAITDDNWITTYYIQDDYTVGSTLGSEDWLTYSGWGGVTGKYVTGLAQNTTYKIKVKARRGDFTESGWSAEASASTSTPSITFGVDEDTVAFDDLHSGNSYTDSSKSTILTTSTNAYNGYTVYAHSTGPLTFGSNTISDYTSPNSDPTVWSGTGFGYTTDDDDLAGGTADRFTNGGPKFAGLGVSIPGDPVADHAEKVDESTITDEEFTISYQVTADADTIAGGYSTTILYIVVPEY